MQEMDQQSCRQQVSGTHDAPVVSGTSSAKMQYKKLQISGDTPKCETN